MQCLTLNVQCKNPDARSSRPHYNQLVTEQDPDNWKLLAECSALIHLHLHYILRPSALNPYYTEQLQFLSGMSNLQLLELDGCVLKEHALEPLRSCTALHMLRIDQMCW